MDLKQLQYFVTVANEGNITSAAKKLFMSQPPLSTQLKLLEQELGCVLLERGSRQIKLTEAGQTLYNYATTLLEVSRVAKEEVLNSADCTRGTIRIGMVSSVVCSTAIEPVSEFSKQYPNMIIEITEGNTYELIKKLHDNTIHCAIIRSPYSDESLTSYTLGHDSLVAVGKRYLFDDDCEEVSTQSLSQKDIIVYRRWEHIIRAMFDELELSLHCRMVCDDARTTIRLAECGLGIGIVPESALELIHDGEMTFKRLPQVTLDSRIELVYGFNSYMPKCTKLFVDFLSKKVDFMIK